MPVENGVGFRHVRIVSADGPKTYKKVKQVDDLTEGHLTVKSTDNDAISVDVAVVTYDTPKDYMPVNFIDGAVVTPYDHVIVVGNNDSSLNYGYDSTYPYGSLDLTTILGVDTNQFRSLDGNERMRIFAPSGAWSGADMTVTMYNIAGDLLAADQFIAWGNSDYRAVTENIGTIIKDNLGESYGLKFLYT